MDYYLKDLLTTTKDGDWGKGEPTDNHTPYSVIRGTDFESVSQGDGTGVPVRYLPDRTVERRRLQVNDILIETAGGSPARPTGRTMLITQDVLDSLPFDVTCASFARFLRVDNSIADPRYVYWFLKSLYLTGEIEQYQVQHTGVARFQYTHFAQSRIVPLPDRRTQEAISSLLAALETKILANLQVAEMSTQLCDLIFEDLYRGLKSPEVSLANVVSTQYGITTKPTNSPSGQRLIRVTDINKKPWITWTSAPTCSPTETELQRYAVKPGDILVARMADPGKVGYVDPGFPPSVFASYLVRLSSKNPENSLFIFHFLRSRMYQSYCAGAMSGSVQKNMNARVIVDTNLRFPEQRVIAEFNARVHNHRAVARLTLNENSVLMNLRNTLIPNLLSGRIEVSVAVKNVENIL